MSEPRLTMRGVHKRYGAVRALAGVDLEVGPGEVHALVGENGAGKSTLLKILSGAVRPDEGALWLDGAPYAPRGPTDARRRGVAMVYQELTLAPDLTVAQNLVLGRESHRAGWLRVGPDRARVTRALARLGRTDLEPGRRVRTLGPGERQLVEIARALVEDARVVVLDEPTSSLSAPQAEALYEVVARLAADGVSVLFVSHFLEEVARAASRFTVLRDGRSVATGALADVGERDLVEAMVGRPLHEVYPEVARTPGEPALTLRRLEGAPLPRDASLTLRRGEILGLAGLVGAGRTELLRALFGLAPVRAGQVVVAAYPGARRRDPRARIAQGLGLLSEDRKQEGLALSRSIADNLTLSRLPARLGWLDVAARARAAGRWIEELRIKAAGPAQAAGELSGGNQQKVALARLLHQDADVLLLDEPTRGVDVGSKVEIYRLIGGLAAAGKAVLVASSYLPELLGVCDRIAVMHRGILGPARPAREWTQASLLEAASRGERAA